ncbi:PAQR family membrane homeostasis protein TrhA [Paenibacillus sp. B1-35]|uniref:PAQR family membrane homeostasis protein TrhA n=3 Tax=unclassified Paenibacillus TaxID=185978 RepID=UPI003D29D27A
MMQEKAIRFMKSQYKLNNEPTRLPVLTDDVCSAYNVIRREYGRMHSRQLECRGEERLMKWGRNISGEERANVITHAAGLLFSLWALGVLIGAAWERGTIAHVIGASVYGITLTIMFTTSAMMHSMPEGRTKFRFTILDHMAIYLFIAGTYTPFMLIVLQDEFSQQLFGLIWGTAIVGMIYKAFYTGRHMWFSTIGYAVMGWLMVTVWDSLMQAIPFEGVMLLVMGGGCYTAGIPFFVWRRLPYHHAIWHLFVLAGSILHFICIYRYVI